MIRLSQVTLRRGAKVLLEGADLALNAGEKIGLIGANGSGKSSLFALLRGELHADQGEVDYPARWRVSHVAQETPALERPALEYAIDGDTRLRELEAEVAATEAAEHTEASGVRLGELHAALNDADAYTARSRAEQLLHGLGFTHEQMNEPVASFSGGWRMRLNLAQALMCPSDLLLLDEPTNHLDLDAILWVEEWLKRYGGTLLIVSHDRDFLDGVVNVIVNIDNRRLRRYSGNYSSFEDQRAAAVVLATAQYEKQQRERAHLESFINRFRAKATKARQAQSRMKMLARMEELAPLHVSAPFSFEFREPIKAPNPLLTLEDVSAGYRDGGLTGQDRPLAASGSRSGAASATGCSGSTARASPRSSRPSPGSSPRSPGRRPSTRASPSATSRSTRWTCCASTSRRCGISPASRPRTEEPSASRTCATISARSTFPARWPWARSRISQAARKRGSRWR